MRTQNTNTQFYAFLVLFLVMVFILLPSLTHASFGENFYGTEIVKSASDPAILGGISALALGWKIGLVCLVAHIILIRIISAYDMSVILYFKPTPLSTAVVVHHVINIPFLTTLLASIITILYLSYKILRRTQRHNPQTARWKIYTEQWLSSLCLPALR